MTAPGVAATITCLQTTNTRIGSSAQGRSGWPASSRAGEFSRVGGVDAWPEVVAEVGVPGPVEHLLDGEDTASGVGGEHRLGCLGGREERLIGTDGGVDLREGPTNDVLYLPDREQQGDRLRRVHSPVSAGDEVDADRLAGGRAGVLGPEGHVEHGREREQIGCTPAVHRDLAAANMNRSAGPVPWVVPVDQPVLDAGRRVLPHQRGRLRHRPVENESQPVKRSGMLSESGQPAQGDDDQRGRRLLDGLQPASVELLQADRRCLPSHVPLPSCGCAVAGVAADARQSTWSPAHPVSHLRQADQSGAQLAECDQCLGRVDAVTWSLTVIPAAHGRFPGGVAA